MWIGCACTCTKDIAVLLLSSWTASFSLHNLILMWSYFVAVSTGSSQFSVQKEKLIAVKRNSETQFQGCIVLFSRSLPQEAYQNLKTSSKHYPGILCGYSGALCVSEIHLLANICCSVRIQDVPADTWFAHRFEYATLLGLSTFFFTAISTF